MITTFPWQRQNSVYLQVELLLRTKSDTISMLSDPNEGSGGLFLRDWNSRLRSIGCASVDRVINDLVSELAFLVTSSPAASRVCQLFLLLQVNWKKGNESPSSGLA